MVVLPEKAAAMISSMVRPAPARAFSRLSFTALRMRPAMDVLTAGSAAAAMREMTSWPYLRWGLSREEISKDVPRPMSARAIFTVVVPMSTAAPMRLSGPREGRRTPGSGAPGSAWTERSRSTGVRQAGTSPGGPSTLTLHLPQVPLLPQGVLTATPMSRRASDRSVPVGN